MRLLLVIAMFVASLSFAGVVKAGEFCAAKNCQHEMSSDRDDAPSKSSEAPCDDCCMHHCGHFVFSGKVQNSLPAMSADQLAVADTPRLRGYEPSGLLRPPRAA